MPRYVILEHDWPILHWDLLLEVGSVLRAWRLLQQPCVGASVVAEANADHRLMYLDYQGEVSGGRGQVRQWDAGTYELLSGSLACEVVAADEPEQTSCVIEVLLCSPRWRVRCRLQPATNSSGGRYQALFMAEVSGRELSLPHGYVPPR
jgi:hypothetical protein